MDDVVGEREDQEHGGDSVESAAEGDAVLEPQEGRRPPGLGVLEGEARDDQEREAHDHEGVGDAEMQVHARHLRAVAAAPRAPEQLAEEVDQVVQDHEPQSEGNQDQVGEPDRANHPMLVAPGGSHVDGADGESPARPGVANAAGLREVRGVDGGAGV